MIHPRQISLKYRIALTGLLMAGIAWLRFVLPWNAVLPFGYTIPIMFVAWLGYRPLLWGMAGALMTLVVVKYLTQRPALSTAVTTFYTGGSLSGTLLTVLNIFVVAAIADLWMGTHERIELQNAKFAVANIELATREKEIARSNEELQSQTEELERQSEELRVANEELASHEKILQTLLELSRSLTTELSRSETMERICETLGQLINGPGAAAAILEQEGNHLVVRCHHGFGPAGLVTDTLPMPETFGGWCWRGGGWDISRIFRCDPTCSCRSHGKGLLLPLFLPPPYGLEAST